MQGVHDLPPNENMGNCADFYHSCEHAHFLQVGEQFVPGLLALPCPFCTASNGKHRLAIAILQQFIKKISLGNVFLYPQKITSLKGSYRFFCGDKNDEFQAVFSDFLVDFLPNGCPHCAESARMPTLNEFEDYL